MAQATAQQPKAIFHPWVDALAIGGLSIGFITFLLLVEPNWNSSQVAEQFVILSALLNWPHFMATYFLLYGSKETVERYPWSTKWMPLLLGAYCLATIFIAPYSEMPLNLALFSAGAYLAWHYTGQTWGMMATFSYLGGAPIDDSEKKFLRLSLRLLLVWHLVWFLFHPPDYGLHETLLPKYYLVYRSASIILIGAGIILGGYGMYRYIKRIERTPPIRVLIPFVSIWLWYALLAVYPFAIFWVQLSHALQYLLFPARVEVNRKEKQAADADARGGRSWLQLAGYAVLLLGSGVLIFEGFPRLLEWTVPLVGAGVTLAHTKAAIGAFINIHHFFADGAIWKISNPAVRGELFSHLKR
ncbi:hypothetical protein FIV42_08690 [Persicimonas caeni]|uniref:Uncharacterized protein n=1 Tax=Persicimonas caeni TaxID=2292766 RepID=A0A4Y6PR50_PERCE|nr:hypothetical protein [Persicimonas caeni]QDG50804.1 hypothetical protein FIV42_08690 [Persicimonas caeni]QED32025.1 hypothetical protein FRD00_08685 [Persicimonas caeni]